MKFYSEYQELRIDLNDEEIRLLQKSVNVPAENKKSSKNVSQ